MITQSSLVHHRRCHQPAQVLALQINSKGEAWARVRHDDGMECWCLASALVGERGTVVL